MQNYSSADLRRITGASKSHLTNWVRCGVFKAAVRDTQGTGYHRQFSFSNLGEAVIARELQNLGVNVPMIGTALHGLRQLDDMPKKGEEPAKRWLEFRDPATRPDEWEASLYLTPHPEAPVEVFLSSMAVGEPEEFPRILRATPGRFITLTVDLGNIVRFLESRTDDDWWRPVGYYKELRAVDEARKANLKTAAREAEDAGIDIAASEYPEVALDRRLREECGLGRRPYDAQFWRSIKVPGLKTVPEMMTHELAEEYKRSHPKDDPKAKGEKN